MADYKCLQFEDLFFPIKKSFFELNIKITSSLVEFDF